MRFLGVTETCDLGALYLRLAEDGHEVRISVSEPLARGTLAGLVGRTDDWRAELDWIRAAGDEGIILFEAVSEGFGALKDELGVRSDQAMASGRQAAESMQDAVRERPMTSMCVAFGIGILIGHLLDRR